MAVATSYGKTMEPGSSTKIGSFMPTNGEPQIPLSPTPKQQQEKQQQTVLNDAGDSMNFAEIWRKPVIGELYIRAEYITHPVATSLVDFARLSDVPVAQRPLKIADMCCGTGVVSAIIQKMMKEQALPGWDTKSVSLTCADSSQAQLEVIRDKCARENWIATDIQKVDVMHLPFPSDHFDIILNSMAVMLVADPYSTLQESFRVLKPGGTFAISTWHTEGWVADTCDAVMNLALPGQPPVSWPKSSLEFTGIFGPGAWESPAFVKSMFRAAGFIDVEVTIVTKWIPFKNADEWVYTFEGLCMATTDRFWTKEERKELFPRLMPTVKGFLQDKYKGNPITVERTFVIARGRKP